ncbi:MAG: hypothetical protein OEW16_07415 [Gammaproteobacteria bacterium]|nr:hypothetical protein [Gammaproteobacteria bacterium]
MSDSSAAIAHLENLLRILRHLESEGIALYEHQYHPQAFGSFVLVLGRPHQRAKFTWDGREFILSMSIADFPNKSANVPWTHDADFSLPNGQGLYEEIASQTTSTLAI